MSSKNPFENQSLVPGVSSVVLVGSGKGGVGKSSAALNLACGLKRLGLAAGVLDADIYGPSLPRLTGTLHCRPEIEGNKLIPLRRFGLNLMSMGHLTKEDDALIWRGPMLFKAVEQLFRDVDWGRLDVLIADLPPGTGDVVLTVAQKIKVAGGVAVATPQNLSLSDTRKAVSMFKTLNIPLIGVVENMSGMETAEGETIDLFPKGQLDVFLKTKNIPKLASVPFHPHIGLSCEAGVPFLESRPDSKEAKAFLEAAGKIKSFLEARRLGGSAAGAP